MSHFLYAVTKDDQAPVGDGDAPSWLRYYKLEREDFVFIPMVPGLEDIQSGDMLWFAIDGRLYGAVRIERIEEDVINSRKEIWFNGGDICPMIKEVETGLKTAPLLDSGVVKHWLQSLSAP